MTWYYWIWLVGAAILFFALFMMVLWASLANAQVGDPIGGFLTFVFGTPAVGVIAAAWPIWFPFTFAYDVIKSYKEKKA